MRTKTTVVRAYLFNDGQARRTVQDSKGRVWCPARKEWTQENVGEVVTVPNSVCETWQDLPTSWLGYIPYFR